jgi:outer membrane protein TolC
MFKFLKPLYTYSLITLIAIISCTPQVLGQTVVNPDSALVVILNNLEGTPISLLQIQEYSKKNSTAIRQAEAAFLAAKGILRRERGAFDPAFFLKINYEDQKIPTASFFSGAPVLSTQQTETETGLHLNLPIGTVLEFSLNTSRLKTNSEFAFLNPEYDAFGALSLRQPLLSGFEATAGKDLKQAELNFESAKAVYDQEILKENSTVEKAYWNLYTAERDYAVQKLTLERAEAVLKEAQLREKAGLVGPNQVANAKTFLAEQRLFLIDKEEQLDSESDQLVNLTGNRPESGKSRFLTSDSPPNNFPEESLDNLLEQALQNNLEIKAAQKNIEVSDALVNSAAWQVLPQVDLVASLTSNSLGGTSQNVIFGGDTLRSTNGGNLGTVLSQVFKRKFPGWSVGIELTLPIGLRKGLGEKDHLEAGLYDARQNYIMLSRSLEKQIRDSYRELIHGNERLRVSKDGVEAAQEQVRIGTIEFQNGRLTAFELVRLSEDLALAQQRYSEALVKTVKAAAELKQLTSGYYPSADK